MLKTPRSTRSAALRQMTAAASVPLFAALSNGRARAQTTPKLRVAAIPIDVAAASYYAQDMGFFKKHGLDVEVVTGLNGSAIAAAVAGGSLDVGDGNTAAIATAHERGVPFVLVAPSGAYDGKSPTGGLMVANASPLKSAKDLAGKTVAVAAIRNIMEIAMRAWLNKNGVPDGSVKFVEIAFSEMGAALASGRVDAVVAEEPVLTAITQKDGRVIGRPGDAIGPLWIEGGFFTTLDFAKAHPDVVKRFADALAETNAWANKNHDASGQILGKYAKTTFDPAQRRCYYPERLNAAQVQPLIDAAAQYGVLKASFPAKEIFAPGLG
jgi:NitT/TauT family transport system substrate-binding protein